MERIEHYLNDCFGDYVMNEELENLKEEILANASEHFEDLKERGRTDAEAEDAVIASLGDINGLLEEIGAQKRGYTENRYRDQDTDFIREFTDSLTGLIINAFRRNESDGTRSEVYANIDTVCVSGAGVDIVVRPSKDELVHAEAEGNLDEIEFEVYGGELRIREKMGTRIFHSGMDLKLELPADTANLEVNVVSGDLTMDHIQLEKLTFRSTSGDLEVRHGSAGECRIRTASGDAYLRLDAVRRLDAEQISGDLDIKCIHAGELQCTCQSGDIDAEIGERFERISFKTVSGDISLRVSDRHNIFADLQALSGSVDSTVRSVPDGCPVTVRTISGDIRLR